MARYWRIMGVPSAGFDGVIAVVGGLLSGTNPVYHAAAPGDWGPIGGNRNAPPRGALAGWGRSRAGSADRGRALAGAAGGADPVPAVAVAWPRAGLFAGRQRPRPVDLRALFQPCHYFCHARAHPSRRPR